SRSVVALSTIRDTCLESYRCPRCFSDIRARSRVDKPARNASAKNASSSGSCLFRSGQPGRLEFSFPISRNSQFHPRQSQQVELSPAIPITVVAVLRRFVASPTQKLV